MEAAKAQNWAVEPQERKNIYLYIEGESEKEIGR
jgi:hypothetical protein